MTLREKIRDVIIPVTQPKSVSSAEAERLLFQYAWDEEEERYDFSCDEDEEIEPEVLDLLSEDTDFRAFLPDGLVSEGGSVRRVHPDRTRPHPWGGEGEHDAPAPAARHPDRRDAAG